MIYGYIGSNKHTLEIYDTLIVEELWNQRFFLDQINVWNLFQFRHPIDSYYRIYKTRKWIEKIISKNGIKDVFIGDINNTCYQLFMLYYKHSYNFHIFEEGSSHYVNSSQASLFENIWVRRYKAVVGNLFYYLPFWGVPFASSLYLRHLEYNQLPIYKRYSIRPHYKESFDEQLYPCVLMSEKVRNIINKELGNVKTKDVVLFLSEPVDEFTVLKWKLEILTLRKELESIEPNSHVVVKFHPRETDQKKQDVLKVFKEMSLSYSVICEEINIPVEYILQVMDFKMIMTYFCSTLFYNGYLYKKTKAHSMLPVYYKLCKEYDSPFTKEVESFLRSDSYKQLFAKNSK